MSGPKSSEFRCVADAPNIFLTGSGKAAISLALRCLQVGPGERVLVPTYHCPTMIAPVVASGAIPIFFGIDASGAPLLDLLPPEQIHGAKAIIVAHYFGIPQPMARIRDFCDRHHIALIEDCAHAMFGESEGRPIGQWGDYAIASIPKFFPATEGGLLVSGEHPLDTLKPERMPLINEIKALANFLEAGAAHGGLRGLNSLIKTLFSLRKQASAASVAAASPPPKVPDIWLVQYANAPSPLRQPSIITRWVLRHAARRRIVARRRENYRLLTQLFTNTSGAHPLLPHLPDKAVPYVFPLWVDQPDKIYQIIRAQGIPVFRWDETWPHSSPCADDQGTLWSHHIFQLGCHQDLSIADMHGIAAQLHKLLSSP